MILLIVLQEELLIAERTEKVKDIMNTNIIQVTTLEDQEEVTKMIDKYGEEGYTRIKMSQSIHTLFNILEDFEISNTRYSKADKEIVRHMILNCQEIGGLVTEDHRED